MQKYFIVAVVIPAALDRFELTHDERARRLKQVELVDFSGIMERWSSKGTQHFELLKSPTYFLNMIYTKYVTTEYTNWLSSSDYQLLFVAYEDVSHANNCGNEIRLNQVLFLDLFPNHRSEHGTIGNVIKKHQK